GVTAYRIERCQGTGCASFVEIKTVPGVLYSDTGLSPGTSYSYRVRANDAAGNRGGYSNVKTVTTGGGADTIPPSAPASITATASSASVVNLSWGASTDNVGVTGYKVERCLGASCSTFAQIATTTSPSFSNSGLASSTTYRYRVRATDAAGNLGGYSTIATVTTKSGGGLVNVTYIQNNYATPQTAQSSVNLVYKSAQTAGNLNVVVVGWNDTTATVTSVTDSNGNVYTRAVGPTVNPGMLSQSIYYATNIAGAAANANVVTVSFSTPATYPDIRVLEYSGVDPANPVDIVA